MPRAPRKPRSESQDKSSELSIMEPPVRRAGRGARIGVPRSLPLLPIRNQVYFPHMIFPLLVGREKSVRALDEAIAHERHIMLVAQKHVNTEDPDPDDLYEVGIAAEIMQILRVPDGTVRVMLEGLERCRIREFVQVDPFYQVNVEPLRTAEMKDLPTEAMMRSVTQQFEPGVSI